MTPLAEPRDDADLSVRERRDAAANRRRLLRAARRVIGRRGADGFSMDAVAAAAGVGKGTLFRRFGDRSGLLRAVITDYLREFEESLLNGPPPLGPGAPAAQRLESFLVAAIHLQHENPAFAMTARMDPQQHAGAVAGPLHAHVRSLLLELDVVEHTDILATMLLEAVSPTSLHALFVLRGESIEDITAAVVPLLRGLVPHDPPSTSAPDAGGAQARDGASARP